MWYIKVLNYNSIHLKCIYFLEKSEKFYHPQIYNIKNVKEISLDRSMVIPEGNLDLHKGEKKARSGKYIITNKKKKSILNYIWDNWQFTNTGLYFIVYNIYRLKHIAITIQRTKEEKGKGAGWGRKK